MGYGWGDDTRATYSVPSSSDDDYADARKAYEKPSAPIKKKSSSSVSGGRSTPRSTLKTTYVCKGKTEAPVGKDIQTDSLYPIVVAPDHTGSMGDWIDIILEKLPLLGTETGRYVPEYDMSAAAIGDRSDQYCLQVRDFASGEELVDHFAYIYPERKGGPNPESYGLLAYYYLNHCKIDKAVKPLFIMILDSVPHEEVLRSEIKEWTGDVVQNNLNAEELISQLADTWNLYVVYADRHGSGGEAAYWERLIGKQSVIVMSEPRDVVEIIIGIIAAEFGKVEDHEMRSSARHSDRPDRLSRLDESLRSIREKSASMSADGDALGKSKLSGESGKGMTSKKLV